MRRLFGVQRCSLRHSPRSSFFRLHRPVSLSSSHTTSFSKVTTLLPLPLTRGCVQAWPTPASEARVIYLLWPRSTRLSASGTTVGRSDHIFVLRHICTILGNPRTASSYCNPFESRPVTFSAALSTRSAVITLAVALCTTASALVLSLFREPSPYSPHPPNQLPRTYTKCRFAHKFCHPSSADKLSVVAPWTSPSTPAF